MSPSEVPLPGDYNDDMQPLSGVPKIDLGANSDEDDSGKPKDAALEYIVGYLKSLDKKMYEMNSNMYDEMKRMNAKMGELQENISSIRAVVSRVTTLEEKVKDTSSELSECKTEMNDLRQKYDELLERHLNLDTYSRRNNLVFLGIKRDANENCSAKVRSILKSNLAIPQPDVDSMRFEQCHRISSNPNSPIICRFVFREDRELVWSKRFSLRGTKIFIAENFPKDIEERRQKLFPIMRAAKAKNMKAVVKYDKLIIDGTAYSAETLQTLPPDLQSALVATETKNGVTCFFTSASPLSNFHRVEGGFVVDGKKFDCVERFFQMTKALSAEQPAVAQKILNARSAPECKKLGDSINIDEKEWIPRAQQAMFQACRAKFVQHLPSQRFLLNTGQSNLAEAGPDKTWGIGLKMQNPDAFIKSKWLGENKLGLILERIRQELTAQSRP